MRIINRISRQTWHVLILPIWDGLTFLAWGILLLKYWLTGDIKLLIHPNYISLVVIAGFCLTLLGSFKLAQVYQTQKLQKKWGKKNNNAVQHFTLFPAGWSTFFLFGTAMLAFLIPPTVLNSEMALQRGSRDSLPIAQTQPESFQVNVKPEERSLIDWIKTLNAYPEPDAYQGQPVQVEGFVIKIDQLPEGYFLLARFIIACCAIDAYPVAIPVKLDASSQNYAADTWLNVQGEMTTETLPLKGMQYQENQSIRQNVIRVKNLTEIPTPVNPYGYSS